MRYNRRSVDNTMTVAIKSATADGQTRYVFVTGYGFTIDSAPPPFDQRHYKVTSDGFELIERKPWEVR